MKKNTRSKNLDFIVCSAYLYSTCPWQLCPVLFCSHRCDCFILARFGCFGGQARAKKMAEVVGGGFCLPFTFCLLNWAADVCSLEACELSYGWFAWPCAAGWVPGEAAHLWSQPGDGSAAFSDNTRQGHWGDLVSIAGSFFFLLPADHCVSEICLFALLLLPFIVGKVLSNLYSIYFKY